jgi:hypothetical protein
MSLIKYRDRADMQERDGQPLYWGRAGEDGVPYRGPLPFLTEEEYREFVVRVAVAKNGYFDTKDPEQNARYLEIVDCCVNGWFQCSYIERFWRDTSVHYVEWVEFYMQDGRRVAYQVPGPQEAQNGPRNLAGLARTNPFA